MNKYYSPGHNCSNDSQNLNVDVNFLDIDIEKYDKMIFNPLRYENKKESKLKVKKIINDYTDSCNIEHVECKCYFKKKIKKDSSGDQADFS